MREHVERIERHTNAVYWSDGLLDLLAGLGLVLIGAAWIGDLAVLGAVAPALLLPLWAPLRKRLVEPRRGYLRLGETREADQRRLMIGMLAAGLGALALGVAVYFLSVSGRVPDSAILVRAAPGALIGLGSLAVGWALELPRFAAYAVALVSAGVASGLLGFNPGWAFVVGGGLGVGLGATLLVRFLRRYPAEPEAK